MYYTFLIRFYGREDNNKGKFIFSYVTYMVMNYAGMELKNNPMANFSSCYNS